VKNNHNIFNSYDTKIDGIRALAVLSVWFFHLFPEIFPGGYLGVDLFFVISGYVISMSIIKNPINNNIDIFKFYKKRFFRIFPALFFLIISCYIFYLFFGYLFELNYVSKISIASLLGISNIFYIYLKSDYFLANELNPFLHTWSLGIEEQFYFIYPLIISLSFFIAIRFTKFNPLNILKFFCISLFVFSITLSLFFSNYIIGNFYSPFPRFWELLSGCLLYIFLKDKKFNISTYVLIIFFLSFFIILFFEHYIQNINIVLLFAILFSSLLIVSKNKFINFLNHNFMTVIGKMSYSIYLWHLPIIYFTKIYFYGLTFILINIFLLIILSFFSYNIIEKKIRFNPRLQKHFLMFIAFFTVIFLSSLFLENIKKKKAFNKEYFNNQILRIDNVFKNINFFEKKYNISSRTKWNVEINNQNLHLCEYSHSTYNSSIFIDNNCLIKKDLKNLFIINGDSHATHYYPMILNSLDKDSIYIKTYEGCLFSPDIYVIGKNDFKNNKFINFDKCQSYINEQVKLIEKFSINFENIYLILSSRYTAYINQSILMDKNKNVYNKQNIYKEIKKSLINLNSKIKNINIILISPLPEFNYYPFSCFLNNDLCNINIKDDLKRTLEIKKILLELSNENKNIYLFDPYKEICKEINICQMYRKDQDLLLFKDTDHLTVEGSTYLSSDFKIFLKDVLSN
jgi:peptidoglycan/LPS O-acetylase OafA/YrhL